MRAFLHNKESALFPQAVISIADDNLSAAIVSINKESPQIIWSGQEALRADISSDLDHQYQAVGQALSRLLNRLGSQGRAALKAYSPHQSIARVNCLLSGPWHVDNIVTVQAGDSEPSLLTNQRLQAAVSAAHRKFFEQQNFNSNDELTHLHHRIADISSKSGRITLPHHDPVADFELRMHISKVPQRMKQQITRALEERFQPESVSFSSFTDLGTQMLARQHSLSKRFIFVVVGRAETEILQVVDGSVQEVTTFPVGKDFFTRVASSALGRPAGDIHSRLALHKKQRHHDEHAQEIRVAMSEVGEHWSEKLRQALEVEDGSRKTTHIYFLSDADVVGDLFHDYAQESARAVNLSVHRIDDRFFADQLSGQYNKTELDHRLNLAILGTGRN